MRLWTPIMMAVAVTGCWAAQSGGSEARTVTVCMSGDSGAPVYGAEIAVSEIFSAIGVRIDWRLRSCPASPRVIRIDFADEAPRGISPGALAYTRPYGGSQVTVFSNRVRLQSHWTGRLLAFVLAHEIAHVLQGVARHSETGIMKPSWNNADYNDMAHKALFFTAEDVDLIQLGIDSRVARMPGEEVATR